MKEKSYVEDIDRSIYDFKDDEKDAYKLQAGLTPGIVEKISKKKKIRLLPLPYLSQNHPADNIPYR